MPDDGCGIYISLSLPFIATLLITEYSNSTTSIGLVINIIQPCVESHSSFRNYLITFWTLVNTEQRSTVCLALDSDRLLPLTLESSRRCSCNTTTLVDMQYMLSILLFLLANTTAGYLVPNPPGTYNVKLITGPLIDYARKEPNAATPTPRVLMLSVFQPATCASTVPVKYMPQKTSEYQGPWLQEVFNISSNLTPLFLEARLPVCSDHSDGCSPLDDVPILLFSPGYGIPRLYYNVLASAIASEGFIVITIDSPGDANIITYPDGHAVYNKDTTQSIPVFKKHLPNRIADASFVLDQLSNATAIAGLLPQRGHRPFSTDRVAMLGHSLGGVAAVLAAGQDSRLRGAINWDGTFIELPPPSGVSQPVLLMSHGDADSSWPTAWPRLKGPKLWVNVANATHETFSDVPTLLQAAGQDLSAFAGLLGTIAPAEMVRILTAYTTAWMNGVFSGKVGGPLLGQGAGQVSRGLDCYKSQFLE